MGPSFEIILHPLLALALQACDWGGHHEELQITFRVTLPFSWTTDTGLYLDG